MSASPPPPWFFPAFIVAFPLLWVVMAVAIRRRGGFTAAIARQYGPLGSGRDSVHWCSAQIAGIAFKRCLHVSRVPGGYLFRISRLFLGGGRFIADADVAAMVPSKSRFRGQALSGVLANGDSFSAWGRLERYLIASRVASTPSTGKPI